MSLILEAGSSAHDPWTFECEKCRARFRPLYAEVEKQKTDVGKSWKFECIAAPVAVYRREGTTKTKESVQCPTTGCGTRIQMRKYETGKHVIVPLCNVM